LKLFVQVKKHSGTTSEDGVRQLIRRIADEQAATACLMSLSDEFSKEAEELAKSEGILLMDGTTICELELEELAST
jgi:predicted Mrr-cat superfamily restriction endonuclease